MIQLISLLIFPVTIYYFSPVIIIYGITERVVSGSFLVFALLFLLSVFTGRLFCSTICPAGAVQDIMMDISGKPVKHVSIRRSKWIVFGLWFSIIIYLLFKFGIDRVDPLYQTWHGISVYEPGGYIVYYAVLGIFMFLATALGNRGGCHTICWMSPFMIIGMKLGDLLTIPYYGLGMTDQACIACGKCDKACPMGLSVKDEVQNGNVHNHECISCAKCVLACPKRVLKMTISKRN